MNEVVTQLPSLLKGVLVVGNFFIGAIGLGSLHGIGSMAHVALVPGPRGPLGSRALLQNVSQKISEDSTDEMMKLDENLIFGKSIKKRQATPSII